MKHFFIFSVVLFMCFNIHGEETYRGKIIIQGNPCLTIPCLPCAVLWLETASVDYVLVFDSHWICRSSIMVDGVEYCIDDEVEITGTTSDIKQDLNDNEYIELEIKTIKKLTSNLDPLSIEKNKVYYDAASQVIVIDESLQNQFSSFELVDIQGKVVLRKTDAGKNSISVTNLPNGAYFYCLLKDSQIISIGKIVKKNNL